MDVTGIGGDAGCNYYPAPFHSQEMYVLHLND